MNFIEENYLWFIIGGIVLVMIVIGYIAEKTDFGHKKIEKQEKPKENKLKLETEKKPPKDLKNVKLGDIVYKDAINKAGGEILETKVESINDILTEPIKEEIKNDSLSKEEIDALSVPIGEVASDIKNEPIGDVLDEPIKEEIKDLSVPIGEETVVSEEKKQDVADETDTTTDESKPNDNIWEDKPIMETKKEATNVESEEDIWKF